MAPALTMPEGDRVAVSVSRKDLDAAEVVYSLAMNGDLDHAYELAGTEVAPAAAAFDAVGATAAAGVLRDALHVVEATERVPDDQGARAAVLRTLPLAAQQALAALGDRFARMDDLMVRIESAVND